MGGGPRPSQKPLEVIWLIPSSPCFPMSLTHPSEVKALLNELGIHPNRKMGQNFLIDSNILRILLRTADLQARDSVLEVGPGLGVLTEWLARWAGRVVAVEKDRRLVSFLREKFADKDNVEIVEGDILDQDLDALLKGGVNKVIANLPYAISSRLLFSLADAPRSPEQITVTVQKEVAERIVSPPCSSDYGLLSVIIQLKYCAAISKEVSPTCFLPPPDVKSAILNMERRQAPCEPRDRAILHRLVKTAFTHRRKQLLGTLAKVDGLGELRAGEILSAIGIPPRARPETVPPDQWVQLADAALPTN